MWVLVYTGLLGLLTLAVLAVFFVLGLFLGLIDSLVDWTRK